MSDAIAASQAVEHYEIRRYGSDVEDILQIDGNSLHGIRFHEVNPEELEDADTART